MQIHICLVPIHKQSAKIFKPSTVAVFFLIHFLSLRKMKVFFHKKSHVNGSNGKKETTLINLHFLHHFLASLYEAKYHLQGHYSSSSKISLWPVSLKSQTKPLFASFQLSLLLKIIKMKLLQKVPALLFFKQNIGLFPQRGKLLKLLLRK